MVMGGSGGLGGVGTMPVPMKNAFCMARQMYTTPTIMPNPTQRASRG